MDDDLKFWEVGRDVDLLEDIGGGIKSDNERLSSLIALAISFSVVCHTSEKSEDEATEGGEGIELLFNGGAGGETNLSETEALSSLHNVVVGSVVVVDVLLGELSLMAACVLGELFLSDLLSVEGELSEPRVLVHLGEVEGCSLRSGSSHGESEDRSHV